MTRARLSTTLENYFGTKKMSTNANPQKSGLAYIDVKSDCNPFDLFKEWLEEAKKYGKFNTVSFNLATSCKNGDVSSRTIVMRDFKNEKLIFMTNGNSRKSQQIKDNPKVSACFFWSYVKGEKLIHRQVRVEGIVEELPYEECEEYHNKEPLFCQIRSQICQQGEKVKWIDLKKKHDELLEKVQRMQTPLKMPEYQVGYKIIPSMLDFYFAWNNNIGDRLLFTQRNEDDWTYDRVAA